MFFSDVCYGGNRLALLSVATIYPTHCKLYVNFLLFFPFFRDSPIYHPTCVQIIMLVGIKLQVIITKMGLRIQERGEVVKGAPVVQPGDDLFWFNRPRLLLYLIHFVVFQV